ncbi:hypothetical protein [Jeotgalibacillus campisalis]|uniref:Uncharacterized protein n=1 Tax=Jeotgalibacillus campisalis TaxID=220754 RepID=A0A0C2W4H5_9BACL|nr:hypothetical protein [Jeotgalibacillus campisalis]KIL50958.1 hypothetical protein KR50_08390 [Jeotgalibacillus campisalis]
MNYFSAETVIQKSGRSNQFTLSYTGPEQLKDELIEFSKQNHLHIGYEKQVSIFSIVRKKLLRKGFSPFYEVRLHNNKIEDQYHYPHVISVQQLILDHVHVSLATSQEASILKGKILLELEELAGAVEGGALVLSKSS